MENPFAKFSSKDWLYVGGAVASIVALVAFIAVQKRVQIGPQTTSDALNVAPSALDGDGGVNYINYNMGAENAPPIQTGSDLAPDTSNTSCSCANNDCAGPSPLSTGDTFGGLDQLLQFYQNTNPVYLQLQEVGMQRYAALFAEGETYATGGTALGVQYLGS
jgi:hypothetical protein